jgi:Flp pilus assembly protein TadG
MRSERGSVAIQLGLMMIVILGMVALGVEITFALYKHRQMQSAADSAALGGATALMRGYPADFTIESHAIAAAAGFVNGVNNVTVTVNRPPTLGPQTGNNNAVEVFVSQPQYLGLVALFREGLFQVGTRAVALVGSANLYCVLALDPSAARAVYLRNNVTVGNPDCGVAVNSSSDAALYLRNNAAINGPVSVHGSWSLDNNAELNGNPVINHGPIVIDPYAVVALQPIPSCTSQSAKANNNVTIDLDPGHFCNGWDFKNNVTVNLAPGAYYIDKEMDFGNNVIVNGTGGVTLVINSDYPVTFTNNAQVNITAPSSGPYAGLAFFGLRDARASTVHTFDNNTVMNIKGVIYFPNQIIEFNNNGSTTPGGCTQVIGRIVRFYNNVWLDANCDATGVKPIGGNTLSQLVE